MEKITKAKCAVHRNDLNLSDWNSTKLSSLFIPVSLVLLIFFSILPYASSEVWSEAVICTTIFALNIFAVLQGKYPALENEHTKLFAPLILLAVYSFIQGAVTLLIQKQVLPFSAFFPYSFDLTASFWNAVKIFAFVSFIRLLLAAFRLKINLLVWSLVITGNFFALLGLFRYLIQRNFPDAFQFFIFPQLLKNIGFGTYINQNHFALLMLMTIGLNTCLLWRGNLKKSLQYLLLLFGLITWSSLILTGSRGGIISSFVEIVVLIFFPFKRLVQNSSETSKKNAKFQTLIKKLLIFAAVALILILGVVFIGQNRVVNRFERLPLQVEEIDVADGFLRLDVYEATTTIIKKYPFYGIGFGGFRFAVSKYIDISGQIVPEQAHNDYLEYAASSGIIGLSLAVWFLFGFFNIVRKRLNESSVRFSAAARFGAICGITGVAVHSLFDFGLQMMANLIFFGALLAILIHKDRSNIKDADNEFVPRLKSGKLPVFKYAYMLLFVSLAVISVIFGYSRFVVSHPKIASEFGANKNNAVKFPFDAEYYKSVAFAGSKLNNTEAINNLKNAIKYRPDDYTLWLKLGRFRQAENQNEEAAAAFERAIELAPFYGEPHYFYGKFLIKINSNKEGFEQLHYAFRQNSFFFYEVAALARQKTGENDLETINLLMPLNISEIEMLKMFFLEKESYASLVSLSCQNENAAVLLNDELIKKLLKKQEYYFAHLIYKRICKDSDEKFTGFENGDFEKEELSKGIGFGWRINKNLPNEVKISFDKSTASSGTSSLNLAFNGQVKSNLTLLSQLLFVETNRKYNLTFSYETNKLITGGVPVLQVILKQKNSEVKVSETKLLPENTDWTQSSIEIATDEKTEALEIRVSRQSCRQRLCPIFGNLRLDNFRIKELK